MNTKTEFAIECARSWYVRQIADGRGVPTQKQMQYIEKAERDLDDALFRNDLVSYLKSLA